MSYDSRIDTFEHIGVVNSYLKIVIKELLDRGILHDSTKLGGAEREAFDEATPKLKNLTYGSDEYKENLDLIKDSVEQHYEDNSHHPEHYLNGIDGMNLIDLIEMICDWKAATLRHNDGNIYESLVINKERFKISDQLASILKNTVLELGW
jgi:hypothetical protein